MSTQTAKNKQIDASIQKKDKQVASLKTVQSKNEELEHRLKRTLADYHNLERRIDDERRQLSKLSAIILIEKLLPVLDNIENAQNHLEDKGLEIVIKQFKDVLATEGLEEIETGAQFDPNFHEAVEVQEGEQDGRIVKVLTKGYKIEDRVIRPAKVTVERKQAENSKNEETINTQYDQN